MELAVAVYGKLTEFQALGTLWDVVGGRIYHQQAAQNAALPLVIYRLGVGVPSSRYFDEALDSIVPLEVEAWTRRQEGTYGTLNKLAPGMLADLVIDILDNVELAAMDHQRALVRMQHRGNVEVVEDAYRTLVSFEIRAIEIP